MASKRFVTSVILAILLLSVLSLGVLPGALAQSDDPLYAAADTVAPSYVDGVQAVPGDASVTLSWDASTDNVGVMGYVLYYGTVSVSQAGQEYDNQTEIGNVLIYTMAGLQNNVTYYFAVTAKDAAGNESEEYSLEVSATPAASVIEDDGTPPTVVAAAAGNCDGLTVTFSEPVVLPGANPGNAFKIENLDTYAALEISGAETLAGAQNKVVLSTSAMETGAQYLLTVGIAVEDRLSNPIVSGTSDTAVFSGVACVDEPVEPVEPVEPNEPDEPADDVEAPKLESVEVVSLTELKLKFDEEVILPVRDDVVAEAPVAEEPDPALELFSILDLAQNPIVILEVSYVETEALDTENNPVLDKTQLRLVTEPHMQDKEYFLKITGLTDAEGNVTIGDFKSSTNYKTPAPVVEVDAIAPEDVQNFVSSVMDSLVKLNWGSSLNTAGDLVDQYLYVSTDGGATFEKKGALGKEVNEYKFEGGVEGQNYVFKVTTVDEAGNESEGTVVTATLPVTGPALLGLAAAALMGGGILGRKKKLL